MHGPITPLICIPSWYAHGQVLFKMFSLMFEFLDPLKGSCCITNEILGLLLTGAEKDLKGNNHGLKQIKKRGGRG